MPYEQTTLLPINVGGFTVFNVTKARDVMIVRVTGQGIILSGVLSDRYSAVISGWNESSRVAVVQHIVH